MTVRYGLIGSGMMGHEHIRNLALIEGCEVAAVSDPDKGMRKSAARSAGNATEFADHRELLDAGGLDALIIAAPNDLHHQIVGDCLQANLPILCEKPICTKSADVRDLINRSKERSAPIWVAMEYRYMQPLDRLHRSIENGTIGQPHMMAIREHRFPFLPKVGNWNRFTERTGGTLVEKCCHFWDLMRLFLKSDPVRVYSSAGMDVNHLDERYDGRTPDITDNSFTIVDFENGARGMLDLCMFADGSRWQEVVTVTGDKAQADAKIPRPARFEKDGVMQSAELEIADRTSKTVSREEIGLDPSLSIAGDHFGSTYYQHLKFNEMVRTGGSPAVSLQDGLWSVLVGEAAEESSRTGKAVAVNL